MRIVGVVGRDVAHWIRDRVHFSALIPRRAGVVRIGCDVGDIRARAIQRQYSPVAVVGVRPDT